jgi:hypothetical protein
MSDHDQLAAAIKKALQQGGPHRIAVHNQSQVGLGQSAAKRLAGQLGGKAEDLIFELIPEREQETVPVGTTLV